MISYIASKISMVWKKNGIIDSRDINMYVYGVELILSSLFSIFCVVLIGIIHFSIIDSLLFLMIFIPIRLFSGGYHANSYLSCNISMIITFTSTAYCAYNIKPSINSIIATLIINYIVFFFCCPVENKYKLLDNGQKKRCKLIALRLLTIASFLSLLSYYINLNYYKIIFFTLLAITLLIPIGIIKNKIERRIQWK